MKIAIQGEAGSFSEDAARQMVPGAKVVACARSAEVFAQIQRGSVAAAVIPIENTLAGSVTEHFDLLLANDVFIQREFRMRIVHNLIASPGVRNRRFGASTRILWRWINAAIFFGAIRKSSRSRSTTLRAV